MSALIYDPTNQAYKDTGGNKIYSNGDSAYVDAGGKVWNGSEWVDAISAGKHADSTNMPVGTIVTLDGTNTTANTPIKAVCISNNGMTAVMQSYGFGHGGWPGEGTFAASSYGTTVGNFNITNIQLAKGTSADSLTACGVSGQSSLINTALADAARNHESFGASGTSYAQSWLGTPADSTCVWYINSIGARSSRNRSHNIVVAPCFVLNLNKVVIDLETNILYQK